MVVATHAEYVKEAVQEDQNNNYDKAFELYKIALEYFSTHLKYEKNPRSRAAIQEKARGQALQWLHLTMFLCCIQMAEPLVHTLDVFVSILLQFKEYLSRAEYIKSVIDGQVPAVQAQNGTGQKARGAGGGNDKDAVGFCPP